MCRVTLAVLPRDLAGKVVGVWRLLRESVPPNCVLLHALDQISFWQLLFDKWIRNFFFVWQRYAWFFLEKIILLFKLFGVNGFIVTDWDYQGRLDLSSVFERKHTALVIDCVGNLCIDSFGIRRKSRFAFPFLSNLWARGAGRPCVRMRSVFLAWNFSNFLVVKLSVKPLIQVCWAHGRSFESGVLGLAWKWRRLEVAKGPRLYLW